MPPMQATPEAQTFPQKPQLFGSLPVFTLQPIPAKRSPKISPSSRGSGPHQLQPGLQVRTTQKPLEQPLTAFGRAQTCPHVPQLCGSVVIATQVVPQSTVPVGQVQMLLTVSQVALVGQQVVPQPTVPAGQVAAQAPLTQKAPSSQQLLSPLAFVQTRASGQQPVGVQV